MAGKKANVSLYFSVNLHFQCFNIMLDWVKFYVILQKTFQTIVFQTKTISCRFFDFLQTISLRRRSSWPCSWWRLMVWCWIQGVRPITHYVAFCTNFWVFEFLYHLLTTYLGCKMMHKPEKAKTLLFFCNKNDAKMRKHV